MKKVYIKTYGCQMNVHETEKLYAAFEDHGYFACDDYNEADAVVLNTCAVRENAETHVYGNLGLIKKAKEAKPGMIVAVCGCMSQESHMPEYLHKRCPFINIIIGTTKLDRLPSLVENIGPKDYFTDTIIDETVPCGINKAKRNGCNSFVNITYGCNNFCTYCIVPYVKGRERSRTLEDIKSEVKSLIESGTKEITLLGQNVNSYNDGRNNFYALLSELSSLDGEFWIKFMTSHPKDLSEDVVKLIGSSDKLANYIHLPLQSGSDRILKAMNRKYDYSSYKQKIDWIREYIPSAGISSDIIVGFPSETEDEFLETIKAVEEIKYNSLFMFIYSKRTGTPAAVMSDQIDEKVKKDRIARLIKVQSKIASKIAKDSIGKTEIVLCDSFSDNICTGKTASDKVILFEGNKDLVNNFVNIEIIDSKNSKLYGKVI